MTLIEKLDNTIADFYRTHNYYFPSDVVMTESTMNKLKEEVYRRGFSDWNGQSYYFVPLRIFNDMDDGDFVASGAPKLEHEVCHFCGVVDEIGAKWHRIDDKMVCEDCLHDMVNKVEEYGNPDWIWEHNAEMKKKMSKRYLKYYGNYLFNRIIELNPYLKDVYDENGNKKELYL